MEKLIEQNGIDLCTRDKSGLSPFASAMTFKHQKAAERILRVMILMFKAKLWGVGPWVVSRKLF